MPTAKRAKTAFAPTSRIFWPCLMATTTCRWGTNIKLAAMRARCPAQYLTSLFVITYAVGTSNDSATCAGETRLVEQ